MYHFQEAITNTKGDALIGYYVKAVDPDTGDLVSIYADDSSTPIVSVSGLDNASKVDSDGMARFWIESGTYHLDIYATDSTTFIRRETSLQMLEPIDQSFADDRYLQITDFNDALATLGNAGQSDLNSIVTGCGVAYNGNLSFSVSAGTVYIGSAVISVPAQTITLTGADATNPRIDVLYVDDTGTFGALAGDPAASPSQPTIDATTQLFLTFVLVPAAATALSGITTETIYDEGTEWTASTSGTGFTVGSTNNPNTGTKDIEATSVVAGSWVKFVRSSAESFDGDGNLLLYIRSKALWNSKRSINLRWRLANVTVGGLVTIKDGSFGFDSSLTGGYQLLVIPKALFAIPAGTNVDEFRITALGTQGSAIGFYVDPIKLQNTGTTTGSGSSVLTQDVADARYLRSANNLSDVSSKTTARTNLGATTIGANLFTQTNPSAVTFPRYNADNSVSALSASAFRTAIGAGTGTGTGDMLSTNNLSDVASVSTARTNLGLGSAAVDARATTAEIQAGTASRVVEPDKLVASAAPQTLTDGTTVAWDMSLGYNAKVTIGGNRTLTVSNPVLGLTYSLGVIQDGTGSRTMAWPSSFDWGTQGAPTLTTTASKRDRIMLFCTDASTPKFDAFFAGNGFS